MIFFIIFIIMAKTKKCKCKGCKEKVAYIIGLCKWCNKEHCYLHRIPEQHNCPGLEKCREESLKKNEDLLVDCNFKKIETI